MLGPVKFYVPYFFKRDNGVLDILLRKLPSTEDLAQDDQLLIGGAGVPDDQLLNGGAGVPARLVMSVMTNAPPAPDDVLWW